MTSEEVTAKRRAERKQFKLDRAKAMAAAAAEAEVAFQQGRIVSTIYAADGTRMIPSAATWKPKDGTQPDEGVDDGEDDGEDDEAPLENVEHLQLTLQEAFFLLWNLDCLSISNPDDSDVSDRIRTFLLSPSRWSIRVTL
jgi:tRNA-splicing endonuclease subunit Sen2